MMPLQFIKIIVVVMIILHSLNRPQLGIIWARRWATCRVSALDQPTPTGDHAFVTLVSKWGHTWHPALFPRSHMEGARSQAGQAVGHHHRSPCPRGGWPARVTEPRQSFRPLFVRGADCLATIPSSESTRRGIKCIALEWRGKQVPASWNLLLRAVGDGTFVIS